VRGDTVELVLEPQAAELLDPAHPGWLGLLARGEGLGVEAAAQGVDPRARLEHVAVRDGRIEVELSVRSSAQPAVMPKAAQLMSVSGATTFRFVTREPARAQ